MSGLLESYLELEFKENGITYASMTIGVESPVVLTNDVPDWKKPSYIAAEGSSNIDYAEDYRLIDGSTPIQILIGDGSGISPVLLLEETDYQIQFRCLDERVDKNRILEYIHNNGNLLISSSMFDKGGEGVFHYRFRSKSYVGKCFFNIFVGEREICIPFEIRSKKISYLKDYPVMMEEISEFYTSVIFQSDSPVFSYYELDHRRKSSYYEDFMLLDHMFSKMDLVGTYEQLKSQQNIEPVRVRRNVPAGTAGYIDPSSLIDMMKSSDFQTDGTTHTFGNAIEDVYELTSDTVENRLVKDFLIIIRNMLDDIKKNSSREGRVMGLYMTQRTDFMIGEADRMLSDAWLRDVGRLTSIPFNSSVLQKKRGYRDLFVMYQMLSMGTRIADSEASVLLEGHNKRMYQIYEYWCFIQLYKSLKELSTEADPFPVSLDGGRKTSRPRNAAVKFGIPVNDNVCEVSLYYNYEYGTGSEDIRSYSIPLRPDFSLRIKLLGENTQNEHLVCFDAKYKVKISNDGKVVDDEDITSECWEYDIYKMHTYRDALLRSHGSYVLYPGERRAWYAKTSEEDVIPSVGAIPLIPGSNSSSTLSSDIFRILTKLVEDWDGGIIGLNSIV